VPQRDIRIDAGRSSRDTHRRNGEKHQRQLLDDEMAASSDDCMSCQK
jgi:hypothetical protein